MPTKRKKLTEKKFTLADVDIQLAAAHKALEKGDVTEAKRKITNARNRLDIVRGIPQQQST